MLASLFAAAFLLFAPVTQDFAGLQLEVLEKPGAPKTEGPATVWEGNYVTEVSGTKSTVGVFSVIVTDMKALENKVTEEQALRIHEHLARTRKPFAAQNFRKTTARVGERPMLLLSGTVLAPNANGAAMNSYWVSFIFASGDKVYEFNQVSSFETERKSALRRISAMTLTEGEKKLAVTGVPKELDGEYTIAGVPFVLTALKSPFASTVRQTDTSFEAQYTGVMTSLAGPTHMYELRKLKADDKRTDAELFRLLSEFTVPTKEIPEERFAVKDGSGTVEYDFKRADKDWTAYLRFERDGPWVAVLAGYAPKDKPEGLKSAGLRRVKAGE